MADIQTSTPAPDRSHAGRPGAHGHHRGRADGARPRRTTSAAAGHRCVVLHGDARVGDQWRHRYDSLRLNTPAKYDRLPGIEWPVGRFDFPTGAQMADLLEAYAAQYEMDVRHDTKVTRVERVGDAFVVTTDRGVFDADSVVVATGGEHHPRTPDVARSLDPGIRQLHSQRLPQPLASCCPGRCW